MDKKQTCSICDVELVRPYETNANYVIADEFTEDEEQDVFYAMVHNGLTKRRLDFLDELFPERDRQSLSAEIARPGAPHRVRVSVGDTVKETGNALTKTEDIKSVGFNVPEELFDHVEVAGPEVGHDDDNVALVYSKKEVRPRERTGLVCEDCVDPDEHTIIWGPAKDD